MALASVSGYDKLNLNQITRGFGNEFMTLAQEVFSPLHGQNFSLAPGASPKEFVEMHFGENAPKGMQFLKGTTTLAFVYKPKTPQDKGGIVVAVDSRASSGKYISTSTVMKVIEISNHIVATMAGGAADCQFWCRVLAKQCTLFELQNKEQISVAAASKLLANMVYGYKGMGLSMGTMVAGYDKRGPSLYYVDDKGVRLKGDMFSCGSGSMNAYGILDTFRKEEMTDAEAIELGRKAIYHSTYRDVGSGGGCNVYHVTPEGFKYEGRTDVSEEYYKLLAEAKRDTYEPKI